MRTASRYGTTLYSPNEAALLLQPLAPWRNNRRVIIAIHGRNATPTQWQAGATLGAHSQYWAGRGYNVLAVNAGGLSLWANDTVLTALSGGFDGLSALLGFTVTECALAGYSGGGHSGLQWDKSNASKVVGQAYFAPMTDLDHFWNGGSGGYAADILAAYGGDYANSVGHRVGDELTTWRDKGPIKIWHGSADTTVDPSLTAAFVAGVNQAQVTATYVAADHGTIISAVTPAETYAFLDALPWP